MKSLKNKTAVVTGAASGIGLAVSKQLATEGCHLAISDINPQSLEIAAKELASFGVRVEASVLDVADRGAFEKYADQTAKKFSQINILIGNAGNAIAGTVEQTPIEDYELIMNIHFWGVVYGTKFFLPHIKKTGDGHIVNISSLAGLLGFPGMSAYCSAKFAIRGFTESLRQELLGSGIGVSCVHPGGVKTNIAKNGKLHTTQIGPLNVPQDAQQRHERFMQMALTTAESAAKTIVNGIKTNRPRILVGPDCHMLDALQRFSPNHYNVMTVSGSALLSRVTGGGR